MKKAVTSNSKEVKLSRATDRKAVKKRDVAKQRNAEEIVIREVEKVRKKEAERWLEEQLNELRERVDGIGKNAGYYAEEFFQNAFSKSLTFAGVKFDGMYRNLKVEGKVCCEFDIVLVNGDSVAIIEAKYRIHPNFVEELVTKKLEKFRKLFPMYANYRTYLGIAGLSFDKAAVEEANKFGVGIVRQDGKSIEVNAEGIKAY